MSQLDLTDNIIKNARALIYKIDNNEVFYLLTQEPGGFFTIPGGCMDMGDENITSTIKREIKEELGLDENDYNLTDTAIQKTYNNLYSDPTSDRFGKDTITYLFIIKLFNERSIKACHEIKSVRWFNEADAYSALNADHMKEIFQLSVTELKNILKYN